MGLKEDCRVQEVEGYKWIGAVRCSHMNRWCYFYTPVEGGKTVWYRWEREEGRCGPMMKWYLQFPAPVERTTSEWEAVWYSLIPALYAEEEPGERRYRSTDG
jgi:hypothetical protein